MLAMSSSSLLTLNTRGLKNNTKRKTIFKYLKEKKVDIACLQETHVSKNDIDKWEKEWGGEIFFHEGTQHGRGEAVLVSKRLQGSVKLQEVVDRIMVVTVTSDEQAFTILHVYTPNNAVEKISFFDTMSDILSKYSHHEIVVLGDMNTVISNEADIVSGRPHSKTEVHKFIDTVQKHSLCDVWRAFHDNEKQYTWSRSNPFIARRLDYCLVSESLVQTCASCEIISVPFTDHRAVYLEFNNASFVRGPGYWRFNNSLLREKEFVDSMNMLLDSIPTTGDICQQWELAKIQIRDYCIHYGKQRARNFRTDASFLEEKLNQLEKQLALDPSDSVLNDVMETKKKLEIISVNKAKGAQVRARAR